MRPFTQIPFVQALIPMAVLILATAGFAGVAAAQPSVEDILRRVDGNMTIETASTRAKMTISYRDGDVRELEFESSSKETAAVPITF